MGNYDQRLRWAKDAVTTMICNLQAPDTKWTLMDLARSVDDLNKAWDELTDCLVRQRTERDAQILRLIDELAEGEEGTLMSSIAAGCPVDYPTDPIDGYELTWWSVQYHSDVEVLRHRSVYVAKATWDDAVPEHERRTSGPGAPFEDEWKVYWRGQFTGRNPGWNCYRESSRFDWRGSYATEREALDAAIMLARDELGAVEDRVRAIKSSLEALVQRRATLPIGTEGNVKR